MLVEILYCFTYGTYYSKLTTSLWGVVQQQQRMRVFAEAVQTFKTLGKTRRFGKRVVLSLQGLARTQIPTNINYAVEFPTFGEIAGVNPTGVQWKGLALEEPP